MYPSRLFSEIARRVGRQGASKKARPPQPFRPSVETLESRVNPSHFRGAAMVPSVDAAGLLTVTTTSFWRNNAANDVFSSVTGPGVSGGMTQISSVQDTSDSRFTKLTNVSTLQLPNAGLFQIDAGSCCRVSGILNADESSWDMTSKIRWNGTSASKPITFDFSAVQPEVVRGQLYSGNLSAIPKPGVTLTYDQALNSNITSQPPGFVVNPTTGALSIPAANTTTYGDNTSNIGADYAFSGNIFASDGSQVEFDWLFDAVATASNRAPTVNDLVINAAVGSTINRTATATDPEGDALTWSFVSMSGPNGATPPIAPVFNPANQKFTWNSAGAVPGTWQALLQAADPGGRTDIGTITINLTDITGQFKPSVFFFNQIKPTTPRTALAYIDLKNIGSNIAGDYTVTFNTPYVHVQSFNSNRTVKASGIVDGKYFITFSGGLKKGQSAQIYVKFTYEAFLSIDGFRKSIKVSGPASSSEAT